MHGCSVANRRSKKFSMSTSNNGMNTKIDNKKFAQRKVTRYNSGNQGKNVMAFEIFTDYGTASRLDVTFRESGLAFVSNALLRMIGVEAAEVTGYRIFVDRDAKKIAIAFEVNGLDDGREGARSIGASQKKDTGLLVNCMPVFRTFGVKGKIQKMTIPAEASNLEGSKAIVISIAELVANSAEGL